MERRSAQKSGTNKRQDNALSFYKRVHGTDELSGGDSQGKTYYYAAAEDDKLGWALGDERIDPMFTIRRREQEQEAHSKDSFYKKLRVRIGQGDPEPAKPEAKSTEAIAKASPTAASTSVLPSTGAMRFGFGMMANAAAVIKQDSSEAGEKSKGKKDKDGKPKKDKSKKDKSKKDKKSKR
ncbi:hypothetical protein GGF42_003651 [Coemansia sp. RSA 2424]|nr:hypothetical protein GGF42_003651 [Coemansia sp. RSA 2424]